MNVQDKVKIVSMMKKGASVDDVTKKYPKANRKTLAALKAHVTRGNYE